MNNLFELVQEYFGQIDVGVEAYKIGCELIDKNDSNYEIFFELVLESGKKEDKIEKEIRKIINHDFSLRTRYGV